MLSRRDLLALAAADQGRSNRRIIVVGGHPDDPMSGCGGTMARLSDQGHDVLALCLTRGEAGIRGKSAEETAAIRTAEAEKSCEILRCRLRFASQVDGRTELSADRYEEFRKILEEERPDLVLAHWPIDAHRDHRAAALLSYDAWLRLGKQFGLFYYEGEPGDQSHSFSPTHFVDITAVEPRKRESLMMHHWFKKPPHLYAVNEATHRFRGMEAGVRLAEAFARQDQSPQAIHP